MTPESENLILVTGPGLLKPSYCNYLSWLGNNPVIITPGSPVPTRFCGLVLSGGGDVHYSAYGGDPALCEQVSETRDKLEFGLLEIAMARRVPVLGICRGIQVLNVFLGGTLIGHIEGHSAFEQGNQKVDRKHRINVLAGTKLHAILGEEFPTVNSAHHQAVKELGNGLIVSARTEDGTIEAVELPGEHFVIGVQWHPERDKNEKGEFNLPSVAIREAFLREVSLFDHQ